MKRNLSYNIIWLLLAYVGSFSYIHAQFVQWTQGVSQDPSYCSTSSICWTAPQKFTFMLDFVREMINSIKTIGTEGDYLGKYVHPNRFQWNNFVPETKTVVGKVAQNVEQKLKFGAAATTIFTNPINAWGLEEAAVGSVILTSKNKVFLRDSKLVEEMESLLSDKKYEIWLWWGWYSKVNEQNLALMNTILESYKNKWLFSSYSLQEGVTYNNITSLLTRMLSAMKSFLYYDSTSQFDEFSRWGKEGYIEITFAADVKESIEREYNCARGWTDICDKKKTTLKSLRKTFKTKLSTSSYNNKKVFVDATKRLTMLFSKKQQANNPQDAQAYKDREYDLLMATYGQSKRKDGILFNLIDFNYDKNGDLKTVWSAAAKDAAAIGGAAVVVYQTTVAAATGVWWLLDGDLVLRSRHIIPKDLASQIDDLVSSQKRTVSIESNASLKWDDYFSNELKKLVTDVLQQQALDHDLAAYAEIKYITPAFNVIGQQIYVIKTEIIGDKDKDASLIKNLREAAETQCSR